MSIFKSKASKPFALALAFAILQVYVQAGAARVASADAESAGVATVAPQDAPQGRLTTQSDGAITVNGNSAKTGETIFSGQQLQTPAGTSASVDLGNLGRLVIAPGSNVMLNFEAGRVNIVVTSGCVTLTTYKGVAGTVQANGKTESSDPTNGGTTDTCNYKGAGAMPVTGGAGSAAGGSAAGGTAAGGAVAVGAGSGLSAAAAVALTAAIVGTFAVIGNRVISNSENQTPAPCTPGLPDPSTGVPGSCV